MVDSTTQQIVSESPAIEAYRLGLLDLAKQRAEVPVYIPDTQIAGMTANQQQAIAMGQQGIGGYQPYLDQSNQMVQNAAAGFGGVQGTTAGYADPALATAQQQGTAALSGVQQ